MGARHQVLGRGRPGFTLVELLVVVGVMAILTSLLLPVVLAVRSRALETPCTSQLRQIGQAFHMYLDDAGARPPRFQSVVDGGYLRSPGLLLCPTDPERNWGGLYQASVRELPVPPETVHYSYLHHLENGLVWERLMAAGSSAGIMACQLHGHRTEDGIYPSLLSYEGLVLRLCADGAVVRRQVLWRRGPGSLVSADPWRLFSDAPNPWNSRKPISNPAVPE